MNLEIITPEKQVFIGEATSVKFPGINGGFEILGCCFKNSQRGVVPHLFPPITKKSGSFRNDAVTPLKFL